MKIKLWVTEKEINICKDCKHFRQHYVYINDDIKHGYEPCNVGHCTYPRLKDKEATDTCKYYERKREDKWKRNI